MDPIESSRTLGRSTFWIRPGSGYIGACRRQGVAGRSMLLVSPSSFDQWTGTLTNTGCTGAKKDPYGAVIKIQAVQK